MLQRQLSTACKHKAITQNNITMSKWGPIIVVEDDADDEDILKQVLQELGIKNELACFTSAGDALAYLQSTPEQPFIIFSDVNLPGKNGIEFKRQIDSDEALRRKSIPFIFYSTAVDQTAVNEAYTKMTVQVFFQKSSTYEEIRKNIRLIIEYWLVCRHPNTI